MKICSVANCDKIVQAWGFCDKHYHRQKKHGSTESPLRPAIQRFEEKFIPEPNSGCWIWLAALHSDLGYGNFSLDSSSEKAHRASWILYVGPIPSGLHVLHKCDVPSCVNPAHLFLGTNSDNMADMEKKGRRKWCFGSLHGQAKMDEGKVLKLRTLYSNGVSQKELSKQFGIGKSMTNYICNRTNWKHVP